MFKCKKCGSESYNLIPKGTATGLHCADCGFWHKWVGKDDLLRYQGMQKAKEPTTAEKLLWLVEAGWLEHNNAMRYIVSKDKDFWYGLHGEYKGIHEAIDAAYEWAKEKKG